MTSRPPPPHVLDSRLRVAERLVKMFTMERYTYAVISTVAFLLLVASITKTIFAHDVNWTAIMTAFGSGGGVAFTGSRVLTMFGRVTDLVFADEETSEKS